MSGDKPGVDIGYLKCHKHYIRSEVGVSLFSEGEHNYYGATFGLRLQSNWDIAPFIGIGATAGFREQSEGLFGLFKGSMFSHYSIGITAMYNKIGLTYSLAELDEQGDSAGNHPVRHLVGLVYEF